VIVKYRNSCISISSSIHECILVPLKIVAFTFGVSSPSSGQSATGRCVSCGWQGQLNTGSTFQELPRLRETADNTERCVCDIRVTYINTVKFN
jgi:hypothetical protein